MGNDLKYGLVLGAVVLLIFVGYYALRVRSQNEDTKMEIPAPIAQQERRPNLFEAPGTGQLPTLMPETPVPPDTSAIFEVVPVETPAGPGGPSAGTMGGPGGQNTVGPEKLVGQRPGGLDAPLAPVRRLESLAPERPAAASGKTYKIEKGDTLGEISKRFYGTSEKWQKIVDANKSKNLDPRSLVVGTEIVIPDVPASRESTGSDRTGLREQRAAEGTAQGGRTHTVVKGDTLYSIAKKYYGDGNDWRKIYDANKAKMSSPDALKVAMTLTIP